MKISERIALYLTALGVLYFGLKSPKYPWLLFTSYVTFGVEITLWILLPMLKWDNIADRLKDIAYFENYRVPKFLLITFAFIISFLRIGIVTPNHYLAISFTIVKIIVYLFVEIIIFFRLFVENSSDEP